MPDTNIDNSQYNQDELNAPSWLNKDFFEMVLKQHENSDDLKVARYEIKPGTGKSDHYASIMFRAKIAYETSDTTQKQISLIIKTTPERDGMKKDILQGFTLFKTEIEMYGELLPQIDQLLKAAGYSSQFYARMIYSSLNPHECIIFEDLVEKGYAVISKRYCTMAEVLEAVSNLARLHAASYKLIQEGNKDILKLNCAFTKDALEKFQFLYDGMEMFKELLNSEDSLKKYATKFEKVEHTFLQDVIALFDQEKNLKYSGIMVLTHGDFHSRNIMVRYDGDTLNNVMLIDFQVCFFGPAVLDLMYASVLMLSPEMRLHHRDEVFHKYIEVFQETLKQMDFHGTIPTKCDFEKEWKAFKRCDFFMFVSYLIFSYAVVEGKIPLSDLVEKAEVRRELWYRKEIRDEICAHLPRMDALGYFD